MKIKKIDKPKIPQNFNLDFGIPITPYDRVSIMNEDDFEDFLAEWAVGYLENQYNTVATIAGSGDKGRDVVVRNSSGEWTIFQCKHYSKPLTPSEYWIEFGKLCYYTFIKDYEIPIKYFIIASKDLGQSLFDLIQKPEEIRKGLIENWNKKCLGKITKNDKTELKGELLSYVENFDFSIVDHISIHNLIEQHQNTAYFKFRFGGGLAKRPDSNSLPITKSDETNNYVTELLKVYSEKIGKNINNLCDLEKEDRYYKHFIRQRESFFSASALRRFSRDEYIDDDIYFKFRNEIWGSVIDTLEEDTDDKYNRLTNVLKEARLVPIAMRELPDLYPNDKSGACHDLVNDKEMSWLNE